MTINRGIKLSASVGTTDTNIGSGESNTLVDTYGFTAAISMGPIEGSSDGLGAVVNADATAIGEDTIASVSAEATANAGPVATSVTVSLVTEAAAASGTQPYASAVGSIELVGCAEWSFSLSYETTSVDHEIEGTTVVSSSLDYLFALNIDGTAINLQSPSTEVADAGGGLLAQSSEQSVPAGPVHDDPCGCGSDGGLPFDGNVTLYDVDFDAFSDDAVIEVNLFALAVEDQMSSVTLESIILIG